MAVYGPYTTQATAYFAGSSCTGPTVNGTRLSLWCDLHREYPSACVSVRNTLAACKVRQQVLSMQGSVNIGHRAPPVPVRIDRHGIGHPLQALRRALHCRQLHAAPHTTCSATARIARYGAYSYATLQ